MMNIFKIAIVGPESTGKSTLSARLAEHYRTVWVPEFARQYIERTGPSYTLEDVIRIAHGQLMLEDEMAGRASRLLICDTNLIVIRVWLEHRFSVCPAWIDDTIRKRKYDIHFLTDIDIPWTDDPQREHPHLRDHLFSRYRETLQDFQIPFHILSGNEDQRLARAVDIISDQPSGDFS